MAKCLLDIKYDIIDKARISAVELGGFKAVGKDTLEIVDSKQAAISAKQVNDRFREDVITPSVTSKQHYFIEPSNELSQQYLNKYNEDQLAGANQLRQDELNRGVSKDSVGEYLQLNDGKVLGKSIEELDNYLLNFIKQFGVKAKEFEELKSKLGLDAFGATDVMNKLIWYTKNRNEETIPEEVGHMAVMLMGEQHPDIQKLLANIKDWSEYSDIEKVYSPIYNNEKQVKIEAIGKLIAKSLVKNYKASGTDKNLLEQALDAVRAFIIKLLGTYSLDKNANYLADLMQYNNHIADHIAINMLMGNKNYISNIKNINSKLDYHKALANNPFAQSIINTFTKFKFKLTGSLAIAGQGENIYRSSDEPIHDIDFTVNSEQDFENVKDTLNKMNAVPIHFGWSNAQKDYNTLAFFIPKPGYKIEVVSRDFQKGNGWVTNYKIIDSSGKEVEKSTQNHVAVDFFINKYGEVNNDNSIFKSATDIYNGKLTLSSLGNNERLFQREKDQNDYVLHTAKTLGKSLPQFVYNQLEGMPASTANAETVAKMKEAAKKMGVNIQDLAKYAKETGLDTTTINGVADLVKGIVAIAEQKEGVALTEELVHIAFGILEQTNPKMVTEMIAKIDRFKIYNQTLKEYGGNKNYQLANGKPDIRKIKIEAVGKLIAEVIVNQNEGSTEFPELRLDENQSLIRKWWNNTLDYIKGIYRKSNISVFEEAAKQISSGKVGGTAADIRMEGTFYQTVTDKQKEILDKIQRTQDNVKKVISKESVDPLLLDSEEATNYYESKQADGTFSKDGVKKRVTDRVKAWYASRFRGKTFTKEEKEFNELKRKYGVAGHSDFEEIHGRYYNNDGTKRSSPLPKPSKFSLENQDMYDKLEKYYVDLINSFPKDTLVFSEKIIYDPKNKEAGTIDFLAIEPSGKAHILDWKFMQIAGDDVAWFKQGAYNIQLGTYKNILREHYGVKEFGMIRAIPIAFKFNFVKDAEAELSGIAIGSADATKIEDVRLIPISEESESTGDEALDGVIKSLNALLKQIGKEEVTDESSREFKIERLNTLKHAIRLLQGKGDLAPLIDVIEVMRKNGELILNDYNAIYKDRPATSSDSNNPDLSDFSENMNNFIKLSIVFGSISDDIGHLIYTPEMAKQATTEEQKKDVKDRQDILRRLQDEATMIRKSQKEISNVSLKFADKHIGERNLTTGLTKPEVVIKGLASMFRGISELPSAALDILFKLTRFAQGRASQESLSEVEELMSIREKLMKKGGDIRNTVQKLYQKDSKGGIVNKIIYKYSREFHDTVDKKAAEGGDKEWLLDNINVDAYKEAADKIMNNQIAKINRNSYKGTPEEEQEQRDKYILQAKRQWDISRSDFNGFNNYELKRHPLPKWYSEQYKEIQKDPDLVDLYNFLTKINTKSKNIGYISNTVASTFLPFIRKSMAEELAWNNSLSVMKNFGNSLKIKTEDVGYGSVNEITGELENSIPKYYTHDFTFKDGVNDYSDVSQDLFKNMILYIQQVNKYKYMSEVEGQLKLVKTIEDFKDHLNTTKTGKVVRKEDGDPDVLAGNEVNAKMYDQFLRTLLYEQKYVIDDSDVPLHLDKVLNFVKKGINSVVGKEIWKDTDSTNATSLVKTIDSANRAFQLKTLGFEFISGAVNMFGGNIQVATQAGNYFKAREFIKNETKLLAQNFESEADKEMFVQLVNTFMPMKEDPATEEFKKAGMSKLTNLNIGDLLMVFMRKPEQLIEKSVFVTLLQNMMVENGKIVSIRDFVKKQNKDRYAPGTNTSQVDRKIEREIEELKKTRSIDATKKLENGKLVIPGLDLNNRDEIQRITNLSRTISRNATGGMTEGDINRMSMSIWTKSMMLFKGWIPKLTDTRFSEFRKVSDDFSVYIDDDGVAQGQKYDVGRLRLLGQVMSDMITDRSFHLINLIKMNEAGLAQVDKMFEKYREQYESRTGQTLVMSREDFIDMIRTNLRNQVKELAILGSLVGVMLSMGFMAPDDDKDKAAKNFHNYSIRVVDKFVNELSFFYNPINYEQVISGSMFPALGIITDFLTFTNHLFMETTGLDLSNPELSADEVRKKAKPIKYAMKTAPLAKSLVTYLSIFNTDFAKENDVTIQKESSIK